MLDMRTSSATMGLIRPLTVADCDNRPDVHIFVPDVIGILLYLTSKFMVAISRTEVNHDGHGGTAPDATIWDNASSLRVIVDHASLPGPSGFWDSSWCSISSSLPLRRMCLSIPAVSTPSLILLFFATLHWPQVAAHSGTFGISYLELIIVFILSCLLCLNKVQVIGQLVRELFAPTSEHADPLLVPFLLQTLEMAFVEGVSSLMVCLCRLVNSPDLFPASLVHISLGPFTKDGDNVGRASHPGLRKQEM